MASSREDLRKKISENIDKIEAGKEYTYKKICEIFGLRRYNGGNEKSIQFDELKNWMKLTRSGKGKGTRYIVEQKYSVPIPTTTHRNGQYLPLLQDILLNYLSKKIAIIPTGEAIVISPLNLAYECGIVSRNYCFPGTRNYTKIQSKLSKIGIYDSDINAFTLWISGFYRPTLIRALNHLKKQGYIDYKYWFQIGREIKIEGRKEVELRPATDDEFSYINSTQQKIFNELKAAGEITVSKISSLFLKKDEYTLFYSNVNNIFKENNGWDIIYRVFIITVRQDDLAAIAKEDVELQKRELKQKVYDYVITRAKKESQKTLITKAVIGKDIEKPAHRPGYFESQEAMARFMIFGNDPE